MSFLDALTRVNAVVNDFVWVKVGLILLLGMLCVPPVALPAAALEERLGGDEIGYSAERVEAAEDLESIPDIMVLANLTSSELIDVDLRYQITSAEGLRLFSELVNSELRNLRALDVFLTKDIDMSDVTDFVPIGRGAGYAGTFDGQGHTITGLTTAAGGLFGVIGNGGKVQNLKLADVKIALIGSEGAIARTIFSDGIIADCVVEGSVNGDGTELGGIVGGNYGTITGCSMEGTVTNTSSYTGGIVGRNNGDVINCHSSATIEGHMYVGGIAGRSSDDGMIIACCSTGEVSGGLSVGGVVGNGSGGFVICSYATSKITGEGSGGVVGYNESSEVIACYYAVNGIFDKYEAGGVIGDNGGNVTACYWSGYDGSGIGSGTGEATKVDGESVSWSDAVTAMNAALTAYDWEWSLDTADSDALPTPVKKETN